DDSYSVSVVSPTILLNDSRYWEQCDMPPWTIESLAREVSRIESRVNSKVSREVYQTELAAMKEDIKEVKDGLDHLLRTQLATQRTAIWQLVAILVTLVVAAVGAMT